MSPQLSDGDGLNASTMDSAMKDVILRIFPAIFNFGQIHKSWTFGTQQFIGQISKFYPQKFKLLNNVSIIVKQMNIFINYNFKLADFTEYKIL